MTIVLVLDDSLTVRMDLADALETAGFEAVPVGTIAEARRALETRPIAVAIFDVRLPDGDGVSLLDEVRANPAYAALPVLMLSTEAEVRDRIRGLRTGANDYVGKPYDTALVITRVRELAGRDLSATHQLVLVIDDSPTFRAALVAGLVAAGYATVEASSGPEGLRIASTRRPAAIIVDGAMPDMDGASVIRRIRLDAAIRTTPCVLLTGSQNASAELDALDAGADAFVHKETDVDVVLARLGAVLRAAREPRPAVASLLGPKRVLAVDDSATYLHTLADQLRDDGYDVVLATSGQEALDLLAVQDVDCILLDRIMPGMSGAETCQRIKAAPVVRDIPLIMLTALEGRDAMIDGLAAGADDFISKSSGLDVLKARVQAQIRRKQFEDEHRRVREQLLRVEHEAAEARAARALAEAKAVLADKLQRTNAELEAANQELETFSYSVSHDLRAPLRAIRSFTQAIAEDLGPSLDASNRDYFDRVVAACTQMSELIEALLRLSRIRQATLEHTRVDLSELATEVFLALAQRDPDRVVVPAITPGLVVDADRRLMHALFENLLQNAWKFTGHRNPARIEVGATDLGGELTYFVRDDGAGFDMAGATRLFTAFERLHTEAEFAGTGIGLATVRRIVERHNGRIWAESTVGHGATFFFTIRS